MHRTLLRAAAIIALFAASTWTPAAAQDPTAEIERKAKAGEKDNGFCAGSGFEKLEFARMPARINQALAQSRAAVRMAIAIARDGRTTCFLFVFAPPAQREGKNCRATQGFACVAGGDCRLAPNDFICESRPGVWN